MNNVVLSGYVGRDTEVTFSKKGTAIGKFSLAVAGFADGQKTTTWFNCVCFGKTAELANKYVLKGSHIEVSGSVEVQQYEDKEGNKRTSVSVIVNNLGFLDKKSDNDNQEQKQTNQTADNDDSDLPF